MNSRFLAAWVIYEAKTEYKQELHGESFRITFWQYLSFRIHFGTDLLQNVIPKNPSFITASKIVLMFYVAFYALAFSSYALTMFFVIILHFVFVFGLLQSCFYYIITCYVNLHAVIKFYAYCAYLLHFAEICYTL